MNDELITPLAENNRLVRSKMKGASGGHQGARDLDARV